MFWCLEHILKTGEEVTIVADNAKIPAPSAAASFRSRRTVQRSVSLPVDVPSTRNDDTPRKPVRNRWESVPTRRHAECSNNKNPSFFPLRSAGNVSLRLPTRHIEDDAPTRGVIPRSMSLDDASCLPLRAPIRQLSKNNMKNTDLPNTAVAEMDNSSSRSEDPSRLPLRAPIRQLSKNGMNETKNEMKNTDLLSKVWVEADHSSSCCEDPTLDNIDGSVTLVRVRGVAG